MPGDLAPEAVFLSSPDDCGRSRNHRLGFQMLASSPHTSSLLFTPMIETQMVVPFGTVILATDVLLSARRIGRVRGTTELFKALGLNMH